MADAIVKGIEGFDREKAFEAITKTAMNPDRGNGLRMKYGYIPCDLFNAAVAYDMEYALADGAAARAAEALGRTEEANYFTERSHSYRNCFDPATRFMRGRDSKGGWRTPFNPFASTHRADDYCEGNAWQYTWLVPHDVEGLVGCFGSREEMLGKLDSLFTVSSIVEGAETSPDISGLIGQYAHGNEPSHHVLYLYTMLGQPWKTADKVREVLTTLYRAEPDGPFGQRGRGADVCMVRPLVAGHVRGRTRRRTLLVRIAPVRSGRSEGSGRDVCGRGREQLRGEQVYPAYLAQWSTLHEALDRPCRHDEGRRAALRDGR